MWTLTMLGLNTGGTWDIMSNTIIAVLINLVYLTVSVENNEHRTIRKYTIQLYDITEYL